MKTDLKKITLSGLFLALCMVLPFLTGQIPQIGNVHYERFKVEVIDALKKRTAEDRYFEHNNVKGNCDITIE